MGRSAGSLSLRKTAVRLRWKVDRQRKSASALSPCYVALGAGDGSWEDEIDPGVRGIDQFLADPS
jgi:hypothetical protein